MNLEKDPTPVFEPTEPSIGYYFMKELPLYDLELTTGWVV
jgi:hypothetical protein